MRDLFPHAFHLNVLDQVCGCKPRASAVQDGSCQLRNNCGPRDHLSTPPSVPTAVVSTSDSGARAYFVIENENNVDK